MVGNKVVESVHVAMNCPDTGSLDVKTLLVTIAWKNLKWCPNGAPTRVWCEDQ